jgi:hypothetical protein
MPDMLDTASAWLDSVHKSQVSQTVVIRSGSEMSAEISATIGSSDFQEDNGEGIVTNWQSRDYMIAVADYQLSGRITKPFPGHQILEAGRTYEVVSPGDEPAARYSDTSQRTWRVHTKLIDE